MQPRKPDFFICYLRENSTTLQAQFNRLPDKDKTPDVIVHSLFLLTHYSEFQDRQNDEPARPELILQEIFSKKTLVTLETFGKIKEIYLRSPESSSLSSKEVKEVLNVITEEGFTQLFDLNGIIREDISTLLKNIFRGIPELINDPLFLFRAYTFTIWIDLQSQMMIQSCYDLQKKVPQKSMPSNADTLLRDKSYFAKRLTKPAATITSDITMTSSTALLMVLCAIEAPILLFILLPTAYLIFHSRYEKGYYFFQQNEAYITPSPDSNSALSHNTNLRPT